MKTIILKKRPLDNETILESLSPKILKCDNNNNKINNNKSVDCIKIRDLYKISFPHHYNRLSNFNKLKNKGIISDDGVWNSENLSQNFKHTTSAFSILSSLKSDSYSIKNDSKVILLSFYSDTGYDESYCYKYDTFQYLICIPNKIESINGEINLEYSRFIKASFKISSKYDYYEHFENDDSGYDGVLLKDESYYDFELFDINEPTFDDDDDDDGDDGGNKKLSFKNYDPESIESEAGISVFELWFGKFNESNQEEVEYVKESYVKGLVEFSRNSLSFSSYYYQNKFFQLTGFNREERTDKRVPFGYDYNHLFSSVYPIKQNYKLFNDSVENNQKFKLTDISKTPKDVKTLLQNIIWKNSIFFLTEYYIKKFNKEEEEEENEKPYFGKGLGQFVRESIILENELSFSEDYYSAGMISSYDFKFLIPYDDNNNLIINLKYYDSSFKEEINFTVEDKLVNSNNGCCISERYGFNNLYSYELQEEREKIRYDKKLISDGIDLKSLSFSQFISLLLKKKYPNIYFKLSDVFAVSGFDCLIDFTDDENKSLKPKIDKVANFNCLAKISNE
ncbi:hypothetical protein DDB_G0269656 [Dictyostelium discoideum AX4]|uniref:Uncharacterized protein n=1 Tax=Dictyostelium discoideum TaxID=44689 RepID=Q55DI0_DICDI|nr:hypothetical protein DDB_G0269656 [Dictyostelium discoideum AX4]EAL72178.1 hypothetical protein DDB_G0269656 [Dictyostelium discoideum AX4]|eukprot:XP_646151.1 hypothetical protein DDB_G0269656 [Dictyostelium discoideum AX4]